MKALVKNEKKDGLCLLDVPEPTLKAHEVLVKIKKTSICGTDLSIYKWTAWAEKTIPVPMTIGHEFVGEIVEVGPGVKHFKVGQRVTGEGHLTCGHCEQCRKGQRHLCPNTIGFGVNTTGCFAEYFTLPEENVFPLPEHIPDDLAAIFDPYGNAMHTIMSFPVTGLDVLITGAGPIGIMGAAIAKLAGAHKIYITDMNDYRLELAKKMGATHTINVSCDALPKDLRFDVGFEMSGSPKGFNDLLAHMKMGGKVALLGILPPGTVIDWDLVIFRLLHIKGIYGREIFHTWQQMVKMIEGGLNINSVITHTYPYKDYKEAFAMALSGKSGKIILDWSV